MGPRAVIMFLGQKQVSQGSRAETQWTARSRILRQATFSRQLAKIQKKQKGHGGSKEEMRLVRG